MCSILCWRIIPSESHSCTYLCMWNGEADMYMLSNWPQVDTVTRKVVQHQALVLGLGSMFNHSRLRQNVGWRQDVGAGVVIYTTLRDIEVTHIVYDMPLWFSTNKRTLTTITWDSRRGKSL